jgi:hypothetical protein
MPVLLRFLERRTDDRLWNFVAPHGRFDSVWLTSWSRLSGNSPRRLASSAAFSFSTEQVQLWHSGQSSPW